MRIALLLLFALTLTACGGDNKSSKKPVVSDDDVEVLIFDKGRFDESLLE